MLIRTYKNGVLLVPYETIRARQFPHVVKHCNNSGVIVYYRTYSWPVNGDFSTARYNLGTWKKSRLNRI